MRFCITFNLEDFALRMSEQIEALKMEKQITLSHLARVRRELVNQAGMITRFNTALKAHNSPLTDYWAVITGNSRESMLRVAAKTDDLIVDLGGLNNADEE